MEDNIMIDDKVQDLRIRVGLGVSNTLLPNVHSSQATCTNHVSLPQYVLITHFTSVFTSFESRRISFNNSNNVW
jgi:hypothetical protein